MPNIINADGSANVVVHLVTWPGGCPLRRPDGRGGFVIGRLEAGRCLPPTTPPDEVAKLLTSGTVTSVTVHLDAEQVAKARELASAHTKEN
jgi:hypothetical protein